MLSEDFIEQELELPLLVYGGKLELLSLPKQVKLIAGGADIIHDRPYICLCLWDGFIPDKIALFYELIRKQHQVFSRIVVYANKSDITKEHHYFFRELGVDQLVYLTPDHSSIEHYISERVFEAEKIGSDYGYTYQIGHLIESKNLDKLQEELNKFVIVELLNPKTFLMIKALLILGQRFTAKTLLKQLLAADPQCLWAAHQLSMAYLKDSEYGNMLELMERLNCYHKLNPQRDYYLGNIHFHLEDYERSLSYFRNARKRFPQFASRFDEGVAKNLLALDLEIETVKRILTGKTFSDDFVDFLSAYAQRFFAKSKFKQSLRLLKLGLSCSRGDFFHERITYNLSLVFGKLGERQACEEYFKKLLQFKGSKIPETEAFKKILDNAHGDSNQDWKQALSGLKLSLLSFSPRIHDEKL